MENQHRRKSDEADFVNEIVRIKVADDGHRLRPRFTLSEAKYLEKKNIHVDKQYKNLYKQGITEILTQLRRNEKDPHNQQVIESLVVFKLIIMRQLMIHADVIHNEETKQYTKKREKEFHHLPAITALGAVGLHIASTLTTTTPTQSMTTACVVASMFTYAWTVFNKDNSAEEFKNTLQEVKNELPFFSLHPGEIIFEEKRFEKLYTQLLSTHMPLQTGVLYKAVELEKLIEYNLRNELREHYQNLLHEQFTLQASINDICRSIHHILVNEHERFLSGIRKKIRLHYGEYVTMLVGIFIIAFGTSMYAQLHVAHDTPDEYTQKK